MLLPILLALVQDSGATDADLRCMAAIAMVVEPSADSQAAAAPAVTYYLGRIEGRSPGFDLEAGMRPLMTQAFINKELAPTLMRCSAELKQHKGVLQTIGRALQDMPYRPGGGG